MTRKKDKNLSIRTTTRRAEIIMSYAKQSEKTQTQVLEDWNGNPFLDKYLLNTDLV